MDEALLELYQTGRIDQDTAIKYADSPNNLRLKISLSKGVPKESQGARATLNLVQSQTEVEEEEAQKQPEPMLNGINMTSMPHNREIPA